MLTSNASGNLITPVYDASGDTVNDGTNNYLYDAEGRVCAAQSLLSGTITGYLYDAGGNRVAKGTLSTLSCDLTLGSQTPTPLPNNGFVLTAQYLLGPGGEQMTELNSTGAWVHTNVMANGTLFASFDNDGKGVHFFLDDWLGTRRVQTNYLGAVENTWTSLPYGDALTPSASNPDPTEQHFTGKERDAESGLDYFGARYYASSMGRFMSPDWAAKAEPVPYAKLDNPQTLNLYSYTINNPLTILDTDGHELIIPNADLQKIVQALRDLSPAFNEVLSHYDGKDAPNLKIDFGETKKDPSGADTESESHVPLIADPSEIGASYNPETGKTELVGDGSTYRLANKPDSSIVISTAVKGDKNSVTGDLEHEVGHVHDAQTNTDQYGHDQKKTVDSKGETKHDLRPEEQRANAFKGFVQNEVNKRKEDRRYDTVQ